MVTILITSLLLVASLAVVAYPLFSRQPEASTAEDDAETLAQNLRRARDHVYEEVRSFQQEYFLHHLSDAEYQAQLQAARVRAAHLLQRQQQVQETVASIDQALEEEISQAKDGTGPDAGPSAPPQ